ncbi:MAG: Asp-tRNA(Asn)/Glu-tRNA(Gln) amidotransferase subunit GatA, partial [Candidatus Pacebacteria bacterium]|nr:Asp-tRNA(Asn)/Glu-tRNA(Gln) amidotransferase subunit GatA [Candidatus Paceibacterota bacterium]
KKYSAEELTKEYLNRIKEKDAKIHAFLDVFEKDALLEAKKADEKIQNGTASLLTGIPCAIKDNILIEGKRCTSSSKILENYIASYDAFVIKKLKEEGVVFLGKTNMDEFAMGSSTENSAFGPTKNPYDLERVPGGSSGGSAAALAADMCVFSLGSDTGGSIRQPASFCNVVGLKPTYGTVSRSGLMAYASSLDQIGCFTNSVEDSEKVFSILAQKDKADFTNVNFIKESDDFDIKKIKLGVPKEYFKEGLDSEVKEIVLEAIEKYRKMGATIVEISLPNSKHALACYYIIATAEASANLARFDGIRYGLRGEGETLGEIYIDSRTKGFGEEVKRRIMLGTYTLSSGYYDAYYKQALKARYLIKKDFDEAFQKVDAILGPVSPILPFKIGEKSSDPLSMYLADIYTTPINLAGLPAMSLPLRLSKQGLPVGLHLITPHFKERRLFNIAKCKI